MWSISGKKYMNFDKMNSYIINKIPEKPVGGIILGSGLGGFINTIKDKLVIPYSEIPNYPVSSVSGHSGDWVFGYINNKPIICSSGRFHIYEGYSIDEVTIPVSIMNSLGCKQLIITNSSGCLEKDWSIGDIMLIKGYMDYTFNFGRNNIVSLNIDKAKTDKMLFYANKLNINLREGIYTWTLGPSYETPAEIVDIYNKGGNAVGMSTVPEIIKSIDYGLDVIGLCSLTNYAAGMNSKELSHEDVLIESSKINSVLSEFLCKII